MPRSHSRSSLSRSKVLPNNSENPLEGSLHLAIRQPIHWRLRNKATVVLSLNQRAPRNLFRLLKIGNNRMLLSSTRRILEISCHRIPWVVHILGQATIHISKITAEVSKKNWQSRQCMSCHQSHRQRYLNVRLCKTDQVQPRVTSLYSYNLTLQKEEKTNSQWLMAEQWLKEYRKLLAHAFSILMIDLRCTKISPLKLSQVLKNAGSVTTLRSTSSHLFTNFPI